MTDSNSNPKSNKIGKSSVYEASFNFINSIVGSGIIGMPYAIQQSGFVAGVFLICLVAWLVNRSVILLIDCGIKHNKLDYELLSEHTLGRTGYLVTLMSMMMFAYGGQISYFILIGDTIPIIAQIFCPGTFLANRVAVLSLFATVIILPLCLMRDMSSLAFTSLLSIVADVILILIVVIVAPHAAASQDIPSVPLEFAHATLFAGIGTLSFAFVCQHNCFMVFQSLSVPTIANWERVAMYSLIVSFILCLILGLGGYLNFYEFTKADILNSFPQTGTAIGIARSLLAACMILTYPMECYVARHCMLEIIRKVYRDDPLSAYDSIQSASVHHSAAADLSPTPVPNRSSYSKSEAMFDDLDAMGSLGMAPNEIKETGNSQLLQSSNAGGNFMSMTSKLGKSISSYFNGFEAIPMASPHPKSLDRNDLHPTELEMSRQHRMKPMRLSQLGDDEMYADSFINSPAHSNGNSFNHQQFNPMIGVSDNSGQIASTAHDVSASAPTKLTLKTTEACSTILMRCFLTLILWGSSLFIAIVVKDVGVVISLTGAFAASCLGYLLPALIFFETYKTELRAALEQSYFKCVLQMPGIRTWLRKSADNNRFQEVNCTANESSSSHNDASEQVVSIESAFEDSMYEVDIDDIGESSNNDLQSSKESEPSTQLGSELSGQSMTLTSFALPLFLAVFGIASMFLGVSTVIWESQPK